MSSKREQSSELHDILNEWLLNDFSSLEGDTLLRALSDISTGSITESDPVVRRFVVWSRGLIQDRFSELSKSHISGILGEVAQGIGTLRYRLRRNSTSISRPITAYRPDGEKPLGNQVYVELADTAFVQVWMAPGARVTLTFESVEALQVFAAAFSRDQSFTLTLNPPPELLSSIDLQLVAPSMEPIAVMAGAAKVRDKEVLVAAQSLPASLRRLAARWRARQSGDSSMQLSTSLRSELLDRSGPAFALTNPEEPPLQTPEDDAESVVPPKISIESLVQEANEKSRQAPTEPLLQPGLDGWPQVDFALSHPCGVRRGREQEGGPATILLRAAATWPIAQIMIQTMIRRWIVVLREDTVLAIHATPEDPRFSFEATLRSSGMVAEDALEDASIKAKQEGMPLQSVLYSRHLMRHRSIEALDRTRLSYALSLLLSEPVHSWEEQGFCNIRDHIANSVSFTSRTWERLLQSIERQPTERIEGTLADQLSRPLSLRQDSFLDLRALQSESRLARIVEQRFDGETSLAEILAGSSVSRRSLLVFTIALDTIGLLEWGDVDKPLNPLTLPLKAIRAKDELLLNASPFELLGAHWADDEVLLQSAYETQLQVLGVDLVLEQGNPDEVALAQRVKQGLRDALETLKLRDARRTLRHSMTTEAERNSAIILYTKQAEIALLRGHNRASTDALRRVLELDPENKTAQRAFVVARSCHGT